MIRALLKLQKVVTFFFSPNVLVILLLFLLFQLLGKSERGGIETELEGTSSSSSIKETKNSTKRFRSKKNNQNVSEQSKVNSASTSRSGIKINKNNNIFIAKANRRRRITESSDTTEETEKGNFELSYNVKFFRFWSLIFLFEKVGEKIENKCKQIQNFSAAE